MECKGGGGRRRHLAIIDTAITGRHHLRRQVLCKPPRLPVSCQQFLASSNGLCNKKIRTCSCTPVRERDAGGGRDRWEEGVEGG